MESPPVLRRGGCQRLIYQVESPISILLLTIYSKSDREDISRNQVFSILAECDQDDI
ncbi:MAG: hypothetical protein ACRCU2_03195 [Planktothrix sp.]